MAADPNVPDPQLPAPVVNTQTLNGTSPGLSSMSGGGFSGPIPEMTYGMTFQEMGNSGLRAFGGWVREEFLPQLVGRQGQTVYREMRDNSPVIGGMIFAIEATMRKVEWRVNPADDTPAAEEMAEFVDSLREDMGDRTWEETVSEALSMIPYGYAPLEIVYKRRNGLKPQINPTNGLPFPNSKFDDGRIGWAKLPLRGQDTVLKWFFDPYGEIMGLTQQPYTGPLIDLPARKFMLFRPSQHKNNPEGRSVLRNAYRSYYMVKRIEEQEAILYERLNGIPIVKVPVSLMERARGGDGDAAALLNNLKAIAVNLRIDEQMGVVLPSDTFPDPNGGYTTQPMYSIELLSPGGAKGSGGTSSDVTINRHQNNMMMSVLADFLTLGHGKTGTQALAVAKQDMFFQAVESYLNSAAAVFNRQGVDRIWELNGLDPDLMPEIAPDLAQRIDLDVLSNFVLRLAQSGMPLFPNADLQSALLDSAGLPDIADSGAAELLFGEDQKPVPIVGPGAAAAMPQPDPGAAPPPGSPSDKLQKMILGSWARRVQKMGGVTPPKHDKAARLRRKRLPPLAGQSSLF